MYKYETYKPTIRKQKNAYIKAPTAKEITNENFEASFSEAVELHMLGAVGEKEAVKKANDLFKKLYAYDPQNRLVEAYFGSAACLLARDVASLIEKFKQASKGLKMLDHAVALDPDNTEIRYLRASVCSKLPEMYFHRTGTAIEDLCYLVMRYEQNDNSIAKEQYWQILFDLGSNFKVLDYIQDAHSTWDKLLSVTTDSRYRELVKKAGYNAPGI